MGHFFLKLENGNYLLQESGYFIIIGDFTDTGNPPSKDRAVPAVQLQIQSVPGVINNAGEFFINEVISIPTPISKVTYLTIGTNSNIDIPVGTTTVTIVPPLTNTNALTIKGASGDTGISISMTQPTVLSVATGATLYVNAASSTVIVFTFT